MKALAALAVLSLAAPVASAARLEVNPSVPTYGQPVTLSLVDMAATPVYLPATRYSRIGNSITVDYEYAPAGTSALGSAFGTPTLPLGELAPGNYNVTARLYKMGAAELPQVINREITVSAPLSWGLYLIPREPGAFEPTDVLVRSAVYVDPNSMRATVNGNVIRVDFDFGSSGSAAGAVLAGASTWAMVRIPSLAPGHYVVEGWGRDKRDGLVEKYFTQGFAVSSAVNVVEYYSETTDHYFMTAAPGDIAMIDSGAMGDWRRTGLTFKAWLRMGDAPPGAQPVCRFYAARPNSHFYTGNAGDCAWLKALEQRERADSSAKGAPFLGWAYENIAFYALVPENGHCPGGTTPVYRAYNNRAAQNDSNHRFTREPAQRAAMSASRWVDEGVAFCSVS